MLALCLTRSPYLRKSRFCVSSWVVFFLYVVVVVHRKGEKRRVVPRKTWANAVDKAVILRSPTAGGTRRRGEIH